MNSKQYVLPPESVVDIAFQCNGKNYNMHVNTVSGLYMLEELSEKGKKETLKVEEI